MHDLEKIKRVVEIKADMWSPKFSKSNVIDKDDLRQECWVTYGRVMCEGAYNPNCGCSFLTFLSRCIDGDLSNLLRKTNVRTNYVKACEEDAGIAPSNSPSPERMTMLFDALSAMTDISADFVTMIVDEIPKELFLMVRRNMRRFLHMRNWNTMNGKLTLKREDVERYFDVDIDTLKNIYEAHVEKLS